MKFFTENASWLLPLILSSITGIAVWFTKGKLDAKQTKTNIKITEASVVGQNLELYQKMLDDYQQRKNKELAEAYTQINKLKIKINQLEIQMKNCIDKLKENDLN